MAGRILELKSRAGQPILSGDLTLVPIARALRLGSPRWPSGLIWNRPVAVVAQTSDGVQQVIPIRDRTRQIQWLLLAAGLSAWLLAGLAGRRLAARR